MNYLKILDVLLLPKSAFEKITGKRWTLIIGIIFMGTVDLLFPFLSGRYAPFYVGNPKFVVVNAILTIIFLILLGAIDILFFSAPLYDLVKLLKKGADGQESSGGLIKTAKIYLLAKLVTLPLFLILNFVFGRNINNDLYITASVVLEMVLIIWASALVARGVAAVFKLSPSHKQIVFVAVFAWNYLLGYALMFIIANWSVVLMK